MARTNEPSVALSRKHGLNPTMPVCFWCGKETGEIALLGKLKKDAEAPRHAVINYDPCPTCQKTWQNGVLLIEADTHQPPGNREAIIAAGGVHTYPTGSFIVIKAKAASDIFESDFKNGDKVLVDTKTFQKLASAAQKSES